MLYLLGEEWSEVIFCLKKVIQATVRRINGRDDRSRGGRLVELIEMDKCGGNRDEKRGHQGTYFGGISDGVC